MMKNESAKNCQYCGRTIKGRSDKKFCDDSCRNSYHNQLHSEDQNLVRNINHALARNRRILQQLLPENLKLRVIAKEQLYQMGFRFDYLTQVHKNRKGNTYIFCYDHGYMEIDHDRLILVRRNNETERNINARKSVPDQS